MSTVVAAAARRRRRLCGRRRRISGGSGVGGGGGIKEKRMLNMRLFYIIKPNMESVIKFRIAGTTVEEQEATVDSDNIFTNMGILKT